MRAFQQVRSALALLALAIAWPATAAPAGYSGGPAIVSPEVRPDRTVTFRVYAPRATSVRLNIRDGVTRAEGDPLVRGEDGVWSITEGPVDPGTYIYYFDVDQIVVADPQNPAVSETARNPTSLLTVPGVAVEDPQHVAHGAIQSVVYYATAVKGFRRMHVYTPPGFGLRNERYPVLYLLHGGSGSDDTWPTVGRAGFIFDNLIAAGKARPMIVVMPDANNTSILPKSDDDFARDFFQDVMPYVEANYPVIADRDHRAMAGFSQGGVHTLVLGIPHLDKFAYLGVFGGGLHNYFGVDVSRLNIASLKVPRLEPSEPNWEADHLSALDDPRLKRGLRLFWFAIGKDDIVHAEHDMTVALLRRHKFDVVVHETTGGHTMRNARAFLAEFAGTIFR